MVEDSEEVRSVFRVVDTGSTPLSKIGRAFGAVQEQAAKAQIAADSFSKKVGRASPPSGFSATPKTWGTSAAALAGGAARATEKVRRGRAAEPEVLARDEAAIVRAEMAARRARVKGLKFEEQRGNIAGAAVSTVARASHLLGVESNEYTGKIGEAAESVEGLGFQMAAFSGRMGSIGARLVGLAGPIGLIAGAAGLVFQGSRMLAEKLDQSAQREEERARYLGFMSAADKKSFDAVVKARSEEERLAYVARRQMEDQRISARPGADARVDERDRFDQAYKRAAQAVMKYGFTAEQATAALDRGLEQSYAATAQRAVEEAKLVDAERKALAGLDVLPLNANAQQVKEHTEAARRAAEALRKAGDIYEKDVDSVAAVLLARSEQEGSIRSMVGRNTAMADAEARMEAAVNNFSRGLPRVHSALSPERLMKLNAKVADLTEAYAVSEAAQGRVLSPEQIKTFQMSLLQKAKSPSVHFNNNRFDIRQNFAEGFDPDRIAVAFTQDLVQLGERKLQSGLAPPFVVR